MSPQFIEGLETETKRIEDHLEMKLNYSKTDFTGLRRFFEEESWDAFHLTNSVQKKWDEFFKICRGEKTHTHKEDKVD